MSEARRGWTNAVLEVPLTCKLVAASVAVAAAVAGVTLAAVHRFSAMQAAPDGLVIAGAFAAGGVLLAVLNGLLVRLALRPIRELERASRRVEEGDFSARAGSTPFADEQLQRVIEFFNGALDGISELRSRLRQVARRAVERREEERRELAGRLQEDVAQRIAACLLQLRVARSSGDHEERRVLLDDLREDAASVLEIVRDLARELHPPELADIGVGGAIEAFARSLAESTGVEVAVDGEPVSGLLDEEARLALYRITQDLLMDLVQGAECRELRIRLRAESGRVVLELSGPAEEPLAPVRWADSRALTEIRERARYVGGRVVADRVAGRPRIRVELPTRADGAGLARAGAAG